MATRSRSVQQDSSASANLQTWDLPTRIFHWMLVVLLVAAWFTGRDITLLDWHKYVGYSILGLVLFRVFWGFFGPPSVRFSTFLRGPKTVWAYIRTLPLREATRSESHNPLGGWFVLVILVALSLQAITGLFTHEDVFYTHGPWYPAVSGETASLLSRIHRTNVNVILWCAGIHLAALLFYWVWKRNNLITAMITGGVSGPSGARPYPGDLTPAGRNLLALLLALISAVAVCAVVILAPEPPAAEYLF